MINSIKKAVQVMNLFSASEPRLTVTEVSRRLDMPKSTAHSLLATLLSDGFIEKVDHDFVCAWHSRYQTYAEGACEHRNP